METATGLSEVNIKDSSNSRGERIIANIISLKAPHLLHHLELESAMFLWSEELCTSR